MVTKPATMLRICNTPGCWAPADWDDKETGKWHCGTCIAIVAVNRFIEQGRESELGISAHR